MCCHRAAPALGWGQLLQNVNEPAAIGTRVNVGGILADLLGELGGQLHETALACVALDRDERGGLSEHQSVVMAYDAGVDQGTDLVDALS